MSKRSRQEDEEDVYEEVAAPQAKLTKRQETNKGQRARPQLHPGNLLKPDAARHMIKAPGAKRDVKSDLEVADINYGVNTTNLKRVKDLLQKIVINKSRNPSPDQASSKAPNAELKAFESVLSGVARTDRNFQAKVDSNTGRSGKTVWIFGVQNATEHRTVASSECVGDSNIDQAMATAIGDELASLVNRWPGTLDIISKPGFKVQSKYSGLANAAILAAFRLHGGIPTYTAPSVQLDAYELHANVNLLDPTKLEVYRYKVRVPRLQVHKAVTPDLSNVRFRYGNGQAPAGRATRSMLNTTPNADGTVTHESVIQSGHKHEASLKEAEKIARALVMTMEGMVAGPKEADKIASYFTDLWGREPKKPHQVKVYGGAGLITVFSRPERRNTVIQPTTAVRKDIKGTIPEFSLRTLDRSRILPIIDKGVNTWLGSGSVKDAFVAMAEEVENVRTKIAAGLPSSNRCHCSSSERLVTTHHCGSCGRPALCSSMSKSMYGVLVDASCKLKEADVKVGFAEANAQRSFSDRHYIETSKRGEKQDSVDNLKIRADAKENIKSWFSTPSAKWNDGYRQMDVELQPESTATMYTANHDAPTIDAVWPYYPALGGKWYRQHCAQNLELTADALNRCKFIYNPSWLHTLQWYCEHVAAWAAGTLSDDQLNTARASLIKVSTTLRKLAVKANYQRKLRRKQPFVSAKFALDREEWLSGKMRNVPGPWDTPRYSTIGGSAWSANTIKRLANLAADIQAEFQVTLPQGTDGCPWFGIRETMPSGWSWKLCASVMQYHFRIMREGCNGLDPTPDTPDTILIEIIHIICIIICDAPKDGKFYTRDEILAFKQKYGEFLGLPWKADMYDPLCFGFAHRVHGSTMFTGWKQDPTSLADRDDSQNNFLLETRTSNFLKSNYEGSTYKDIHQMVLDIKIPKKWYDRNTVVHAIPENLADDYAQVNEQHGLDFEDVLTQLNAASDGNWEVDEESYLSEQSGSDDSEEEDDDEEEESNGDDDSNGYGGATDEAFIAGPVPEIPDEEQLMEEYHILVNQIAQDRLDLANNKAFRTALGALKNAAKQGDRALFNVQRGEINEAFDV